MTEGTEGERLRTPLMQLKEWLSAPLPSASLGAARALFGLVMLYSLTRFALSGWVEELWLKPSFHFKYDFAPWAQVYAPWQVWAQLSLAWLGALGVTLGLYSRASLALLSVNFIYLQLIDLTNYLNHYYLVACLSVVLMFIPAAHKSLSLDALRCPAEALPLAPRWALLLLRFQLALVYVFAAVAKCQPDWLTHAQPLSIWLSARAEAPLFGPLMALLFEGGASNPSLAYLMSWAGMLYDLTIVGWLLWPKTRPWAYLVVLLFHGVTWLLFDIGIFPLVMSCMTLIFFSPDWPRSLIKRVSDLFKFASPSPSPALASPSAQRPSPLSNLGLTALCVWCAFHVLFPLRAFLSPGDVLWGEEGMRYSWRVMVREKMSSVTYRVRRLSDGRVWEVTPRRYLEPRQVSEMSGQPDMITQLARHIRARFEEEGRGPVEVFADVFTSLNGRPSQRLIRPDVDLSRPHNPRALLLPPPTTPPLSASP